MSKNFLYVLDIVSKAGKSAGFFVSIDRKDALQRFI